MNKRKLSIILAAVMTVNMVLGMAVPAYADVDGRIAAMETGTGEDAAAADDNTQLPEAVQAALDEMHADSSQTEDGCGMTEETAEIDETAGEAAAEAEADSQLSAEETVQEAVSDGSGEYYLTMTAEAEDGVIVVVEADRDVFPEGAVLEASVADDEAAEAASEQIASDATESETETVKRVTYDIRVMYDGEETEPDTGKGRVRVSFIVPDAPSAADTATIYHHAEDGLEVVLDNAPLATDSETAEALTEKAEEAEDDTGNIPEALLADGLLTNDVNDMEDDCPADMDCDCCSGEEAEDTASDCTETAGSVETEKTVVLDNGIILHMPDETSAGTEAHEEPVVLTASVESFSMYTIDYRTSSSGTIWVSVPQSTSVKFSDLKKYYSWDDFTVTTKTDPVFTRYSSKDTNKVTVEKLTDDWKINISDEALVGYVEIKFFNANGGSRTVRLVQVQGVNIPGQNGSHKAEIRGTARQETEGLRTSELLEVHTEGYPDPSLLTFKYRLTNTAGSNNSEYLHIFASSNMSTAKEKASVYQSTSFSSAYSYRHFALVGKAQNNSINDSTAKIEVEVYYNGKKDLTCSYSFFAAPNLRSDISNANFIMFAGEKASTMPELSSGAANIRGMFGLSGVTHISCQHAYVNNPAVEGKSGTLSNEYIKLVTLTKNTLGYSDYDIQAIKEGKTYFTLEVGKTSSCDHHPSHVVRDARVAVWVINKPAFSVVDVGGTEKIQVTNLTKDVSYTIGGQTIQAQSSSGSLVFDNKDTVCRLTAEDGNTFLFRDLTIKYHNHTWSYDDVLPTDNIIKASCTVTDDPCSYHATPQILTVTAEASQQYDGTPKPAQCTNTSGDNTHIGGKEAVLKYQKSGTDTWTETAPSDPGTYTARVLITDGGTDYTACVTYTIGRKPTTFTGPTINSWTYGDTASKPSATADSGQTVTYVYTDLSGNIISAPSQAGTYYVYAVTEGNDTYLPGKSDPVQFSVYPREVTVKSGITAAGKVYDKSSKAVVSAAGAVLAGVKDGDTVSLEVTGTFDDVNTGSRNVILSYATLNNSNYKFASGGHQASAGAYISPKSVTVSGITAEGKAYDGTSKATVSSAAASFSGLLAGDALSVDVSGVFTDCNAGPDRTVELTYISLTDPSGHNNYVLATPSCQQTAVASISAAKLRIIGGIPDVTKEYDGSTTAVPDMTAPVIEGLPAGKTVAVSASAAYDNKNAGEGKTVAIVYGKVSDTNYEIDTAGSIASVKGTITPKSVTVSGLEAEDKIYDGTTAATVSMTGKTEISGKVAGDDLGIAAAGAFYDAAAGEDKSVTIRYTGFTGADAGNYRLATPSCQQLAQADISKRGLVVTGGIPDVKKEYNGSTDAILSAGELTYEGLISGDSVTVTASGTFEDKNVGSDKKVNVSYAVSGNPNYYIAPQSIDHVSGTISQRKVTVSGIGAEDKAYDGTVKAALDMSDMVISRKIKGDKLSAVVTGSFADEHTGIGKKVTLSYGSLSGDDAGNYALDLAACQNVAYATISQAANKVTAPSIKDWIYGDKPNAPTGSAADFGGDSLKYYYVSASDPASPSDVPPSLAGDYYVYAAVEGNDDYQPAVSPKVKFTVYKKGILISGITGADKTYDGLVTATLSTAGMKVQGVVSPDELKITPLGHFDSPDAGQRIILIDQYTIEGPARDNYKLAEDCCQKSVPAVIHKQKVSLPDGQKVKYTGAPQTSAIRVTDRYSAQQVTETHAGKYDVVLTLGTPSNYTWKDDTSSASASVVFEIEKAEDNVLQDISVESWTYRATPSVIASPSVSPQYGTPAAPSAAPKYGTPTYRYVGRDGTVYGPTSELPKDAGKYLVIIEVATTSDYNGIYAEYPFEILPARISLPSAPDKVYNGRLQKAWLYEATPSEEYSIVQNDGGIEVGSYPVVLKAGKNYVWDMGTETAVTATVMFAIIPDPIDPKSPEEKALGEEYRSGSSVIRVHSNIEEGAPLTYIDNLNLALAYSLLTPAEQAEYDAGSGINIELRLNVKEIDEETAGATDSQLIKDAASGNGSKPGIYLDLTLDKIITNSSSGLLDGITRISDTDPRKLIIVIRVPEQLRKTGRTYYVCRVHEYAAGPEAEILDTSVVPGSWIDLSFETDKFSTYAILYKDPSSGGGGSGSGGSVLYSGDKWWRSTDSGWVKKPGTEDWYVVRNDSLVKGWYDDDEDGFRYYLDTKTGIMKEGWQQIGGKWYYFTPIDQVPQGTWIYNKNGDGKWHYYGDRSFHTHGSMYRSEMTPDGYMVDETGARIDTCDIWWTAKDADAGWVMRPGTTDWYYIRNNTLKKGWHDDPEDGHRYYLDPITGIMFKDWNRIGSYMYYFTTDEDVAEPTWFFDRTGDGRWHYYGNNNVLHPLGSMYRGETAPDGSRVSAAGVKLR